MKFITFYSAEHSGRPISINANKIVALISEGENTLIETEGKSYRVEGDLGEIEDKIENELKSDGN